MYERKIPLDPHCGTGIALQVIISKWNYCILSQIDKGITRPKDILESIPDLTKRVLHKQLKLLEIYTIIDKTIYPEVPQRVEYSLTERGKEALPVLHQVDQWGLNFEPILREIMESQEQATTNQSSNVLNV